ncbi:MAG: glycosyltransferase family 4 protein [bacterium]
MARMRIAINTSCAVAGGALTHLRHLVPRMVEILGEDELVLIGDDIARERVQIEADLSWVSTPPVGNGLWARSRWETLGLPSLLERERIDVLFHPGNFAVFRSPVPQVLLVHNLAPFMPWVIKDESLRQKLRLTFLRALTRRSLSVADSVVFISQWGKDLVVGPETPSSDRMPVIPFGAEHGSESPNRAVLEELDLRGNEFVLTVSHLYRYKHVEKLIDAYTRLGRRVKDWPLVIVGEPYDQSYAAFLERQSVSCDARVIFTGGLEAASLLALMQECRVFVFTSEAENLPITLLEAMSAGAPILTNRTCSMPETCADAAAYVDEVTSSAYEAQLDRLLFDDQARADLKATSISRAGDFRWDQAAERTLEVLRDTAAEGGS